MQEVDINLTRPRRQRDADASFPTGLLFGLLVGAGLVVVLSPEFRQRVSQISQDLGFEANALDTAAAQQRAVVLASVAPPPDPLSSAGG